MQTWRQPDEREGQGRRNGLPTANAWEMNELMFLTPRTVSILLGMDTAPVGGRSRQFLGYHLM